MASSIYFKDNSILFLQQRKKTQNVKKSSKENNEPKQTNSVKHQEKTHRHTNHFSIFFYVFEQNFAPHHMLKHWPHLVPGKNVFWQ